MTEAQAEQADGVLARLVRDLARAVEAADARRPVARNTRSGKSFAPGLGPHTEDATFRLVLDELRQRAPDWYQHLRTRVPYPSNPRQKCDVQIATPAGVLYVEGKLLRLLGDNGKRNDNMPMHILSPYPQHNSALTDCLRLGDSGFDGLCAVVIVGYTYEDMPLEPMVAALETLASQTVRLGPRQEAGFAGLCHPVHHTGKVLGWEVRGRRGA
jgi:hypothetical protein